MINNRYILFLLSHPRSRSFHREASTIQPSAFLKFDVAKLGRETRENKKMASTTNFHKLFYYMFSLVSTKNFLVTSRLKIK